MTAGTPEQYLAGRIEHALAVDPRTHELGVRADVRDDVVYVRGEVVGEERRELVAQVVRDTAPGLRVRNEVSVAPVEPLGNGETLG